MRLRRFDLTRYGRFTDFSLDFGEVLSGKPDFHIVYGPNEAGKSTLRNAFLDLLYGIEKQSAYGFHHPYASMQIGGLIETNSAFHDLVRLKKDKNDLLDAAGQPIADIALTTLLGSIDRAGYETMFSLDDDSLQEGGESILKSEGDLGRLLFSAASGLSEFGDIVDKARAETEQFYRPRTRKHVLAEAKVRLRELKDEAARIDVQARDYRDLVGNEAAARELYENGLRERDQARKTFEYLCRIHDALRPWRKLLGLRADIEPFATLPDIPVGWLTEAQDLLSAEAQVRAECAAVRRRMEILEADLGDLLVDEDLIASASLFARLKESDLRARYIAADDIPNRERDLAAIDAEVHRLLKRIGQDTARDPHSLLLAADRVGTVNDLLDRWPGLVNARQSAREEIEKAEDRLISATKRLETIGDGADPVRLEMILETVQAAAHDKTIKTLESTCDLARREMEDAFVRLAPWKGAGDLDGDVLKRLVVPHSDQISQWKSDLESLRQEAADLAREIAARTEEHGRLEAESDAAMLSTGGTDEATYSRARAKRTAAWQAHRKDLSTLMQSKGSKDLKSVRDGLEKSADVFEAALSEQDGLSDLRFERASDLAHLRQLEADKIRVDAQVVRLRRKADGLAARRSDLLKPIELVLKACDLPLDWDPGALQAWLELRHSNLTKWQAYRVAEDDFAKGQADRSNDARLLASEMSAAGLQVPEPVSLVQLVAMARDEITQARKSAADANSAKSACEEAQRNLAERQRSGERIDERHAVWMQEWGAALDGTWLAETECRQSPAAMRDILLLLSNLATHLEKRNDLTHRIDAMRDDRLRFQQTVEALANACATPFSNEAALQIADELEIRLAEALRQQKWRAEKRAELRDEGEILHTGEERSRQIENRFGQMRALFPSDSVAELLGVLEKARKKMDLAAQIAEVERDLTETLGAGSLAEAETILVDVANDQTELDDLATQKAGTEQTLTDMDSHVSALFHDMKTAETALASVDGDAAVARIEEERRTLLLDIEEKTKTYLNLSIGTMMAENALRIYRDRHRNSMMNRAAEAFAGITAGAFSGLTTVPGKTSEILLGLRSDGSSIVASEMSKGTRFQLYLALRIAGYAEFADHRMAFPFFADDIMETFDDDRSAETFHLLSDMATRGQVIYLTHHRHLCEIAEAKSQGGVTLHELPGRIEVGPAV